MLWVSTLIYLVFAAFVATTIATPVTVHGHGQNTKAIEVFEVSAGTLEELAEELHLDFSCLLEANPSKSTLAMRELLQIPFDCCGSTCNGLVCCQRDECDGQTSSTAPPATISTAISCIITNTAGPSSAQSTLINTSISMPVSSPTIPMVSRTLSASYAPRNDSRFMNRAFELISTRVSSSKKTQSTSSSLSSIIPPSSSPTVNDISHTGSVLYSQTDSASSTVTLSSNVSSTIGSSSALAVTNINTSHSSVISMIVPSSTSTSINLSGARSRSIRSSAAAITTTNASVTTLTSTPASTSGRTNVSIITIGSVSGSVVTLTSTAPSVFATASGFHPASNSSKPTKTSGPFSGVETLTQPDRSTTTLKLPSGSSITGAETLTTDGSTFSIGPAPTNSTLGIVQTTTTATSGVVTSTMTTLPPGLSIQRFTESSLTANVWLTTTGVDHSTTIVPVILACATCEPNIVWNLPEVPDIDFKWPSLPQLPTFRLPCVRIFGISIAGSCPSTSGPTPANEDPPVSPEPTHSPSPTMSRSSSSSESCTEVRTVTDFYVSCTSVNPSSTSCATTSSVVSTGCSLTPFTSSTASACPLSMPATYGVTTPQTIIFTPTSFLRSPTASTSSGSMASTTSSPIISLPNLPTLSTGISAPAGSSCASTAIQTKCAAGPSPGQSACITTTVCAVFTATTTTTSSFTIVPSDLPTLTTGISTPAGSSCVSTAMETDCAAGPNPGQSACVTTPVCASFVPTSATTSALTIPTYQISIDIFTDSDCTNVLGKSIMNAIGDCYSPIDSHGNPILFQCFSLVYISKAAVDSSSLTAYKDGDCFSYGDSDRQSYGNWTSIGYDNETPFTMKSLGLGPAGT